MNRWSDLTLGDIVKGLTRYRPFLLTAVAIVLISVVLPGAQRDDDDASDVASVAVDTETQAGTAAPGVQAEGTTPGVTADAAQPQADLAGNDVTTEGGRTIRKSAPPALAGSSGNPLDAADCDRATGRIKVFTFYAPNCIPIWTKGTDNGGATYQGVTKDTITIAIYDAMDDAQAQAITAAAGATDDTTDEEDDANREKVIEAFEHHYETYGRHVKFVRFKGAGEDDDDAAAKSDAIKVATEIKAFASIGGYNGSPAYVDELSARGVLCIGCTVSQPIENYLKWAPHVWSTLMASTQGYVHRAEYVGKRLAFKPAKHAGDPVYQQQQRKFALVWYETPSGQYKAGAQFFERELAKYNVKLTDSIVYLTGINDLARSQEEARVIVARLKDKGVTSVVFSGDPFMPIFLTQEATRQAYRPEWIVTGSALTDTTFFARTYDPAQWSHAFGISFLIARLDPDVSAAERNIVDWHFGKDEALTSYPSLVSLGTFFTGVHLAGPRLTPTTFRDGMFSWKPTFGHITQYGVHYGKAGSLWPWDDYLTLDDTTELWWDSQARCKAEVGDTDGVGCYRYVDMGKRYLPGEWPRTEPKAFDPANTVIVYNERPARDRIPPTEHKHYRATPPALKKSA